jgi:hypothetical protein
MVKSLGRKLAFLHPLLQRENRRRDTGQHLLYPDLAAKEYGCEDQQSPTCAQPVRADKCPL